MNRRRFIACLLAFAACPQIKPTPMPMINPAWVSAPYECEFLFCSGALASCYPGVSFGIDPNPLRIQL
jgi:hypothetical protein